MKKVNTLILFIVILVFSAKSIADSKICFSASEIEALGAVSRNTYYAAISYSCQMYYPELKTYSLHEQLMDRWPNRWNRYFQVAEGAFKRLFGGSWSKEYEQFKTDTALYSTKKIKDKGLVNESYCRHITLENQLGLSDWQRVHMSIDQVSQKQLICK